MIAYYNLCTFKGQMSIGVTLGAVGGIDLHPNIQGPRHSLLSMLMTPSGKYWFELRVAQHLTHVLSIQRSPLPLITVGDNVSLTPTSNTQSKLKELVSGLFERWSPDVLLCSTFSTLARCIWIYRSRLLKDGYSALFSNGIVVGRSDTVIQV